MEMDNTNRNQTKHAFLLFTFLMLLYAPVVLAGGAGFVLGLTIVLLVLLVVLHALEILPSMLENDIPLYALFLVVPFIVVYLLFRATGATRATALLFGYLIVLGLGAVFAYQKKRKDVEAYNETQNRIARNSLRDIVYTLEYLRKGNMNVTTFEQDLRSYRNLLADETRRLQPDVVEKLITSMDRFYETIKRTARSAEPRLSAEFIIEEDLKDSEWSLINIKVENQGAVDGKDIDVVLEGTVELYKKTQHIEYLRRGGSSFLKFQLRPLGHGKILVNVTLETHSAVEDLDRFDWKWRYIYEFELNVSENQRRSIRQMNVQGDFISGSKISIQDSVVTRTKIG